MHTILSCIWCNCLMIFHPVPFVPKKNRLALVLHSRAPLQLDKWELRNWEIIIQLSGCHIKLWLFPSHCLAWHNEQLNEYPQQLPAIDYSIHVMCRCIVQQYYIFISSIMCVDSPAVYSICCRRGAVFNKSRYQAIDISTGWHSFPVKSLLSPHFSTMILQQISRQKQSGRQSNISLHIHVTFTM